MLPLAGVKIIELSTFITGPYAGMLLADMGADVIKIERPDGGDPFRGYDQGNYSPQYCAFNRNKRSMTLDLGNNEAREILFKLVAEADAVIENFRPGVTDRLGVGEAALRRINPELIYCAISGFGNDGPYKNRPAYDTIALGFGGLLGQLIDPGHPLIPGPALADNITGLYAALCISNALVGKRKTGRGSRIDVTMLEAIIAFSAEPFSQFLATGDVPTTYKRATISQSYVFKCADEKLIAIHLSSPEKFWEGLVAAVGRIDLAKSELFSTRERRIANFDELRRELETVFETKPRDYWMACLEEKDVPVAPVYGLDEVIADPQVQHLDMFAELEHPTMGKVEALKPPFSFNGKRIDSVSRPPELGEHTASILNNLGYVAKDVEGLRARGVV